MFHKNTLPSYKSQSSPSNPFNPKLINIQAVIKITLRQNRFRLLCIWWRGVKCLRYSSGISNIALGTSAASVFTLPMARNTVNSKIVVSIWLTAQWALSPLAPPSQVLLIQLELIMASDGFSMDCGLIKTVILGGGVEWKHCWMEQRWETDKRTVRGR